MSFNIFQWAVVSWCFATLPPATASHCRLALSSSDALLCDCFVIGLALPTPIFILKSKKTLCSINALGRMQCRSSSTQASGAGITSACAVLRRSAAAAHRHVVIAERTKQSNPRDVVDRRQGYVGVGGTPGSELREARASNTLVGRNGTYRQNCRSFERMPTAVWYSEP